MTAASSPRIKRGFVTVDGLSIHYREVNAGAADILPTLFMLHPSPMSSAIYETAMAMFPATQHVVAIDTPGYGLSQPLPAPAHAIADYLPTLQKIFRAICGSRFMLYGSATGAQLALGYSNAYPHEVAHLFLDNAAHFEEADRNAIMARYFIDITPQPHGEHLAPLWAMSRQMLLYFPWFEANDAHRIRTSEPTAVEIQSLMNLFLAAGPRYAEAYAAAFKHERLENYLALTVPTTLFRWLGSPLLKQIDDLLKHPLPACINVVETSAPVVERYTSVVAAVQKAAEQ
jgi:pimeloyl-ACP methyl ester carboxylesterase